MLWINKVLKIPDFEMAYFFINLTYSDIEKRSKAIWILEELIPALFLMHKLRNVVNQ